MQRSVCNRTVGWEERRQRAIPTASLGILERREILQPKLTGRSVFFEARVQVLLVNLSAW
jgi:hypothetical protein